MNSFIEGAMLNIAGFDPVAHKTGSYSGWNSDWDVNLGRGAMNKVAGTGAKTAFGTLGKFAMSAAGPISALWSVHTGFTEGGFWGAAKWGAAEVAASGFTASAIAAGGGGEAIVGGMIGGMFGPGGYAAGSAIGSMGLLGPALPVVGGGVMTAGMTYLAAKGSYELLKAGYQHRQRTMRKIDTAGSTAAFMTRNAFTMRTRAIEAIRTSHLNIKSALGQEATRTHFNSYRKFGSSRYY